MDEKRKKEKEIYVEHPLEELFGIEPGSTIDHAVEIVTPMIEFTEKYDEKDIEIEKQTQEIYDMALTAYSVQMEGIETIDPKYRARTMEVGVQFLTTALNAVKEKSNLKKNKDELAIKEKNANKQTNITNNNLVIDRNDLLKMLADKGGK